MNFVLGSHGRLGTAIVSSFDSDQVTALDRSVYSEWWREAAVEEVSQFFEGRASGNGIVYVATGIIDPKAPVDEHHRINFLLARNVIEGAAKAGLRTVTFGTIMEKVIDGKSDNPYFASKTKLGDFVSEFSVNSKQALHIRIHTLYGGGLPDKFMFLGQLFHCITTHTIFNMSPGVQLREYHHIDDEINAIFKLTKTGVHGVVDLSHGAPITLRDLASYVFEQFNAFELLRIGALTTSSGDNYEVLFERTSNLRDFIFRDTLPSVVDYLHSCKALIEK